MKKITTACELSVLLVSASSYGMEPAGDSDMFSSQVSEAQTPVVVVVQQRDEEFDVDTIVDIAKKEGMLIGSPENNAPALRASDGAVPEDMDDIIRDERTQGLGFNERSSVVARINGAASKYDESFGSLEPYSNAKNSVAAKPKQKKRRRKNEPLERQRSIDSFFTLSVGSKGPTLSGSSVRHSETSTMKPKRQRKGRNSEKSKKKQLPAGQHFIEEFFH